MEHYFTNSPSSKSNQQKIEFTIKDHKLYFYTDHGVFSKGQVDFGSDLLLRTVLQTETNQSLKILDMGCGYGFLGVSLAVFLRAASITMADINERAIGLTSQNAALNKVSDQVVPCLSDRFAKIDESFDVILTNPPIRAGKSVIFSIYEEASRHLKGGGRLYVVIRKQQGAESSQKKLQELFKNCTVLAKKSGYQILQCIREV